MSGIEVAGLAFGLVPIVVEILKSYGTAKRRLVSFLRHTEVVQDIHLRFQVAAATFNNDCRLLLQAVVDRPDEVSEMMEDPTHTAWQEQAKDMEKRLRTLMQQDYELGQSIVTRLRDILREVQIRLAKLEGSGKGKESQDEMVRNLWHAFNTSRKENEYLRQLESLDKWNKALSKLRKQRCKIQKRRNVSQACIIRKAVPRSYKQIRVASDLLGESLHDSWSCTNDSHSGHQARLSLDAQSINDDVQLDLVVACQPKSDSMPYSLSLDVPMWLQIRSITSIPAPKTIKPTTSSLAHEICDRFEDKVVKINDARTSKESKKTSTRKRVHFGDSSINEGKRVPASDARVRGNLQDESFIMLDLKTTKSVCCHVNKLRSSTSTCSDGCVGYLDVSKAMPVTRFIFYDASKLARKKKGALATNQEPLPIKDLIHKLQILQQITLAHKLSEAALQYHSTSWLPQTWTLQDVAYFKDTLQSDTNQVTNALSSLHLSNRFPDHKPLDDAAMQECLDLKFTYGVRNLTLARLGVALLEICAQQSLTGSKYVTPHDIIEARKLLEERHHSIMTLGNNYLEIVRKCIYCDFSCDDDLNGEALQSAVYTEVVCALEEMKSRWEKFFGV